MERLIKVGLRRAISPLNGQEACGDERSDEVDGIDVTYSRLQRPSLLTPNWSLTMCLIEFSEHSLCRVASHSLDRRHHHRLMSNHGLNVCRPSVWRINHGDRELLGYPSLTTPLLRAESGVADDAAKLHWLTTYEAHEAMLANFIRHILTTRKIGSDNDLGGDPKRRG